MKRFNLTLSRKRGPIAAEFDGGEKGELERQLALARAAAYHAL